MMNKRCAVAVSAAVISVLMVLTLSSCELFSPAEQSGNESTAHTSLPTVGWPSADVLASAVPEYSAGRVVNVDAEQGHPTVITVYDTDSEEFRMYVDTLRAEGFDDIVYSTDTIFAATKPAAGDEVLGITVYYLNGTVTIDISHTVHHVYESQEPVSGDGSEGDESNIDESTEEEVSIEWEE